MNFLLDRFSKFCGTEKYEKFCATLRGASRRDNQLLFWQESLIAKFNESNSAVMPNDLDGVLNLYRCKPVVISSNERAKVPTHSIDVHLPLWRHYRWSNLHASGGSHHTVFSLILQRSASGGSISLLDDAAPHADFNEAEAILAELAKGVELFLDSEFGQQMDLQGISFVLTSYDRAGVDLKPHKFRNAVFLILKDLLCERIAGQVSQTKLVGGPV